MDGYMVRLYDEEGKEVSPFATFLTQAEMQETYPYLAGVLSLTDLVKFQVTLSAGVSLKATRCKMTWGYEEPKESRKSLRKGRLLKN